MNIIVTTKKSAYNFFEKDGEIFFEKGSLFISTFESSNELKGKVVECYRPIQVHSTLDIDFINVTSSEVQYLQSSPIVDIIVQISCDK